MPNRHFNGLEYRFGFNGKENDSEVKRDANGMPILGSQQDYGMRIYDPRLGRFLSVDPLTTKFAMLTPYQFASNRPIDGIDLDGGEWKCITKRWNEKGELVGTTIRILDNWTINGKAMTPVHNVHVGSTLPYNPSANGDGEGDLYRLENVYTPGGMHPSSAYDYTNPRDMAKKQADDWEYIKNGKSGFVLSRIKDIYYRDVDVPENAENVEDAVLTVSVVLPGFSMYKSAPTPGRRHFDDLIKMKQLKGYADIAAGTAADAVEVGAAWVNGAGGTIRSITVKDGFGWTDGVRTFRLQWKKESKMWKANFQENEIFTTWDFKQGKAIESSRQSKNVHMNITDLKNPPTP